MKTLLAVALALGVLFMAGCSPCSGPSCRRPAPPPRPAVVPACTTCPVQSAAPTCTTGTCGRPMVFLP